MSTLNEGPEPVRHRRYPRFLSVMAWISFFFNWWLFLALAGACVGATLGIIVGVFWDPADIGALKTVGYGFRYGAEYLGKIWGIGISVVLLFVKAMALHRRGERILEGRPWPLF